VEALVRTLATSASAGPPAYLRGPRLSPDGWDRRRGVGGRRAAPAWQKVLPAGPAAAAGAGTGANQVFFVLSAHTEDTCHDLPSDASTDRRLSSSGRVTSALTFAIATGPSAHVRCSVAYLRTWDPRARKRATPAWATQAAAQAMRDGLAGSGAKPSRPGQSRT
jgi:hypothetical protein